MLTGGGVSAFAHNKCDEADEDWHCSTKTDKRGEYDYSRCGSNPKGIYACYEDIKETCEEKISGRTENFTRTNFLGCNSSRANCKQFL